VPTPFDQLSKNLLGMLLQMLGQVALEMEVFGAAQSIDVVFLPDQTRAAARGRLGLLGRMAGEGPCMFEPFSTTPTLLDVRACVRKQYTLDHVYTRQGAQRLDQAVLSFPRLWVLSAGRPEIVIAQYELRPMRGWPAGFWHGRPADPLYVVTLRTLPRQRDTLPLRLMGRGPTFRDAVDDLAALPDDAWERQLALPLLVAFRMDIPQDLLEAEEMNSLQRWQALYAEWEREVKAQGRKDALDEVERILAQREQQLREDGRRQAEQLREDSRRQAEQLMAQREQQLREDSVRHVLLDQLGERFGALPADAVERIQRASLDELERWTRRVLRARTLADVLAA
jgi:hypothetical protein